MRGPFDKKEGGEHETEKLMGDNERVLGKGGILTPPEKTGPAQRIPAKA
jgi:hypothetical protein